VSAAQNITKCVKQCKLDIIDMILEQLASSYAVLTEDEKELGVCLLDIGSGTTDIAVFSKGAIRHTAVIPIAGDQVTNDIAMALRTPTAEAEEIKVRYGVAKQVLADPGESFDVPGLGDRAARALSRQALAAVIEPRVEELFSLVHQVVRESGFEEVLSSGIVLTGGSAMMPGMMELAEDIFLKPARVGIPDYNGQLADVVKSPRYSTVLGLLLEAKQQYLRGQVVHRQASSAGAVLQRMKEWFLGNF
jgi:cell division protein FtsA